MKISLKVYFLLLSFSIFCWDLIILGFQYTPYFTISLCDLLSILAIVVSIFVIPSTLPRRGASVAILSLLTLCYLVFSYLVNYSQADESNELLRFLQYLLRVSTFYSLLIMALWKHQSLIQFRAAYHYAFKATLVASIVVFVVTNIGLDIPLFDYMRSRQSLGIQQLTGIYYEPAAFGQFLIAGLFIFYSDSNSIERSKTYLILTLICVILTQSLGAFYGLIIWSLCLLFLQQKSSVYDIGKTIKYSIYTAISISSILIILTLAGESRLDPVLRGNMLDSYSGSAQLRLIGEIYALQTFFSSDITSILFGLGEFDSQYYRYDLGFSLKVVGNGLVEVLLRYGLIYLFMLIVLSNFLFPTLRSLIYFWVFFAVTCQIDGAIAKPWIWFYTSAYVLFRSPMIMRLYGLYNPPSAVPRLHRFNGK